SGWSELELPGLLSVVGRDPAGDDLIQAARAMGLNCDHLYRSADLPTDQYMAIEGATGLVAAIADAHSLEAAGDKILQPLIDGPLGTSAAPFAGTIALDGNLTVPLLAHIATSPLFAAADLRVAPASPGKAERLQPLFHHPKATFYVNLEEAKLICQTDFDSTAQAAQAIVARGANRAMVTNGGAAAAMATRDGSLTACPPQVLVARVTGAGDTFMAAHIAAERQGADAATALTTALHTAAQYVSGATE
ncbi:MAG: PfkB family carbohydrate kinase, partial [Pseudomonadota bacterium]